MHVALCKIQPFEEEDDIVNHNEGRSGSSTSGVYSSNGSVGSDSPDNNDTRRSILAKQDNKISEAFATLGDSEYVSRLTI